MLIHVHDAQGFPVRGGGHDVSVALVPELDDGSSHHTISPLGKKRIGVVEAKVEDHDDGYYTATFTVTRSGDYNMWARIGGWLVNPTGGPSSFVTDSERPSSLSPPPQTSRQRRNSRSSKKQKLSPLTMVASFPRKVRIFEGLPHAKTSSLDLSRFQNGNVENYFDMATNVGMISKFFINLRDKYGNFAKCERDGVDISITYCDAGHTAVPFSVTEEKLGVYGVEFKPLIAGEVIVVCTMSAAAEDEGVDELGSLTDPYDHRYGSEGMDSVKKTKMVKISGCPFKVKVEEVPLANRLDPALSFMSVLSAKGDVSGGWCWGKHASLGGGAFGLVKLTMRDKMGSPISLENVAEEGLRGLENQFRGLINVTLRRVGRSPLILPAREGRIGFQVRQENTTVRGA
jgi:hypothetical protein